VSYTKKEIVTKAIKDVLKTDDDFMPSPEDFSACVETLDNLVSDLYASGIRWPYPIPSSPSETNHDDETGIPASAIRAVVKLLALELCPMYGIEPTRATKVSAEKAFSNLFLQDGVAEMRERCPDAMLPRGAGYKYRDFHNNFFPRPLSGIKMGKGSDIEGIQ
jgi:hypothetical protein